MATLTAKINDETGTISIVGLRKFPISLYESEWDQVKAAFPALVKFIDANRDHPALVKAREGRKAKKSGGHVLTA